MDARWTKKNDERHYGDQNPVKADVQSKLIESYAVTDASVHDSQMLEPLVDGTEGEVYADSAYRSAEAEAMLALMYESVPPGRLKCTTEELARLVGASPEEVKALLAELKKRGILHTRGGGFSSPFLERLLDLRRGARVRQQRHRDHAETPQGECHASSHRTVTGQITDANPDADKERESPSKAPALAEVEAEAAKISGLGVQEGRRFYEHYQGREWKDKGGKPIRNWKGRLRGWKARAEMGEEVTEEPKMEFRRTGPTTMKDIPLPPCIQKIIDAAPKGVKSP